MAADRPSLRMTLKIDGGFAHVPGLARPIELDGRRRGSTLQARKQGGDSGCGRVEGDEHAAHARRLCAAACAVAQKGDAPHRAAAIPDGRRYRLTIETEGARREVTAADPVLEPAIAELIAFVETHGRRSDPPA